MSLVSYKKRQVLVVDDDRGICEIVSRMLVRLGHVPVSVGSGREAVHECRSGSYDLVLLDVDMPGMSGTEVYSAVRQASAEMPILFMSGYRTEELASSLKNDSAVGFLSKPFPLADLRSMVSSLPPRPSSHSASQAAS